MRLWTLELLGGLTARRGEQKLARFRTQQTGALLAYLATHLGPHPRGELAERFWPGKEEDEARQSLSTALNWLRDTLEGDKTARAASPVFAADKLCVGLADGAVTTDVAAFETLAARARQGKGAERLEGLTEAARLYRGPFLAGYADFNANMPWIAPIRERLEAAHYQARLGLAEAQAKAGETREALLTALELVEAAPLDERARRLALGLAMQAGELGAAATHEAVLRAMRDEGALWGEGAAHLAALSAHFGRRCRRTSGACRRRGKRRQQGRRAR